MIDATPSDAMLPPLADPLGDTILDLNPRIFTVRARDAGNVTQWTEGWARITIHPRRTAAPERRWTWWSNTPSNETAFRMLVVIGGTEVTNDSYFVPNFVDANGFPNGFLIPWQLQNWYWSWMGKYLLFLSD